MNLGEQQDELYAIVRIDVPGEGATSPPSDWRNVVTVKGIVHSLEAAKAETNRLNALNSDRGCVYFWQTTRVLRAPGGAEHAGQPGVAAADRPSSLRSGGRSPLNARTLAGSEMMAEGTGTDPTLLSRRLVAFCDILGFTERLKTSPLRDLHATYSRLIDHANSKIFQQEAGVGSRHHRNFARADFLFDSVLLVSNPLDAENGPRSVSDFMSALSQLFESSLGWQLPLRGAIGLGNVLEDSSRRISLSEVIPDLVSAEKQQEWAGVTILAPAVDAVIDGLYGTPATEIPKGGMGHVVSYPVPTKQGAVPSLVLNWPYFCDARDIQAGLAFLTGRKGEETKRFVDFVQGLLPPPARLPSPVGTIETVRLRVYRSGVNIKFCDADGNGADPPEGTTINFSITEHRANALPGLGGTG